MEVKRCQRHCCDMFCVAQIRTHQGGVAREPKAHNEVATTVNEPVVYVADGNCRNPSREAKLQPDLLKYCFNYVSPLDRQDERI